MLGLFFANAYAQSAPAAQQNPIMSMLPLVLVFMVFYFLMIKPQKKKMEQEKKYLQTLEKGVEVYTKSGIIGTICGLTDKIITLEVEGGVKIKFLRSFISGPAADLYGPAKTSEKTPKKA